MAHVAITDTGIGIQPNQLELIFDEFRQADGSATRSYEGTGLGLAISHKLITMMGGKIWAESTPQEGSTFHFRLPIAGEQANLDTENSL